MDNRVYKVEWENDNTRCVIDGCMTAYFVLQGRETPEERQARKDLEAASTPQENLSRLFYEHMLSKWRASTLYDWFEEHAPGYQFLGLRKEQAVIEFADPNHAMLFKLTWC